MFKKITLSIIILLTTAIVGFSQTVLSAGDIAIVAMNCDGTDDFSFVVLVPVSNTTVIKFAESGWLGGGGFRGGGNGSEGTITWTASTNLACGTEVTITSNGSSASSGTTTVSGSWALSSSGDQILAYQGSSATPTFIYAINNDGAGVWQAGATSTNNSGLPTGLTNGTNAVAMNEADNVRYNCSTTTPPAAILAAVSNNTNWVSNNTSPYSLPIACGFTCVACIADPEPTVNSSALNFSNIGCNSMDLNWTSGNGANSIIVVSTSPIAGTPLDQITYTANPVFGSGSTIAAGEFVVYNGPGTTATVTGLTQSTTYYYAIFEYNGTTPNCEENYLTTGMATGNATTIVCACPELTGILVDACGGAIEGINEFFTFKNGNSSLYLDSLTATFPNGGSYCNSGCGTQTWVTNPAYVASLNTTAACGALFIEVDPIPANAEVIVFTGAVPTYNFDFSGLCGTGPYYAVFANNTSTSGRFANYNGTCSLRTLNVNFGSSCTDAVSYDRCLLSNNDGDYVTFDAAGNPTYQNDGCTPTAILPITLSYFKGNTIGNAQNLLKWATTTEINNDYFTIERSNNATNFNPIGEVNGNGNSNSLINYQLIDDNPLNGINYYRLKQTDFDGKYTYSEIIVLNNSIINVNIYTVNNFIFIKSNEINANSKLEIYDVTGRIIAKFQVNSSVKINLSEYKSGIYIYRFTSENSITSDKIIIR